MARGDRLGAKGLRGPAPKGGAAEAALESGGHRAMHPIFRPLHEPIRRRPTMTAGPQRLARDRLCRRGDHDPSLRQATAT